MDAQHHHGIVGFVVGSAVGVVVGSAETTCKDEIAVGVKDGPCGTYGKQGVGIIECHWCQMLHIIHTQHINPLAWTEAHQITSSALPVHHGEMIQDAIALEHFRHRTSG